MRIINLKERNSVARLALVQKARKTEVLKFRSERGEGSYCLRYSFMEQLQHFFVTIKVCPSKFVSQNLGTLTSLENQFTLCVTFIQIAATQSFELLLTRY